MNILKVKPEKIKYTDLSGIPSGYTDRMNKEYDWMAKVYDAFMMVFPIWKKWIRKVIPYIKGKKILEVSFGSGYLMTRYVSNKYEIFGIDYNNKMLRLAMVKMKRMNIKVMSELKRVLKKNGRLLLVDFDFPKNRNRIGCSIVRIWEKFGDIIKDINALLKQFEFNYKDMPAGGFGSVHLFVAQKK